MNIEIFTESSNSSVKQHKKLPKTLPKFVTSQSKNIFLTTFTNVNKPKRVS